MDIGRMPGIHEWTTVNKQKRFCVWNNVGGLLPPAKYEKFRVYIRERKTQNNINYFHYYTVHIMYIVHAIDRHTNSLCECAAYMCVCVCDARIQHTHFFGTKLLYASSKASINAWYFCCVVRFFLYKKPLRIISGHQSFDVQSSNNIQFKSFSKISEKKSIKMKFLLLVCWSLFYINLCTRSESDCSNIIAILSKKCQYFGNKWSYFL